MNVLFITSMSVVAADPPQSRKLFVDPDDLGEGLCARWANHAGEVLAGHPGPLDNLAERLDDRHWADGHGVDPDSRTSQAKSVPSGLCSVGDMGYIQKRVAAHGGNKCAWIGTIQNKACY
jgi:hypothetical protein